MITSRVTALDGMRGLLAVLVMLSHATSMVGSTSLYWPSELAVVLFFAMSSYFLTRTWDARYLPFLLRRFVRLWPTYAVCLAAAFSISHRAPQWGDFFWLRYVNPTDPQAVDPPMWSLILEAWMMPLMPLIVWATGAGLGRMIAALVLCIAIYPINHFALVPFIFLGGAYFRKGEIRNRFLESAVPQWLGKISYSLYLSHFMVLGLSVRYLGMLGLTLGIPLSFGVAWLLWKTVEKPSIQLSRRIAAGKLRVFAAAHLGL